MTVLLNKKPIQYKESFCAFLDILGFENLVNSNKDEDKKKLEQYFEIIEFTQNYFRRIGNKKNISTLAISDSIILSLELTDDNAQNLENLRYFLIAINIIQSILANSNIWLRGAVTSGKVSFNPKESFIVGPGYIKSYKLEQVAKYPRILIDNALVKNLGFKFSQEFIDSINKKFEGGIDYSDWSTDIIFDWSQYSDFHQSFGQDVPLFLDSYSYFFEQFQRFNILIDYLSSNILGDIRHYEKYKWVLDLLITKAKKQKNKHATNEINDILERLLKI